MKYETNLKRETSKKNSLLIIIRGYLENVIGYHMLYIKQKQKEERKKL